MCDFLDVSIAHDKTGGLVTFGKAAQMSRLTLSIFQTAVFNGLLNFCCSVVVLGRAFLRRLIDLTMGQLRPHHQIRLCKEAKLDIRMWLQFFQDLNGRAFFLSDRWKRPLHLIYIWMPQPQRGIVRYLGSTQVLWLFS